VVAGLEPGADDCLIASFCIQRGHELPHHDADYEHFERFLGLRVVHP
jgi:predicted nucleic acid-binding protein